MSIITDVGLIGIIMIVAHFEFFSSFEFYKKMEFCATRGYRKLLLTHLTLHVAVEAVIVGDELALHVHSYFGFQIEVGEARMVGLMSRQRERCQTNPTCSRVML